jgi:hypothetical protein
MRIFAACATGGPLKQNGMLIHSVYFWLKPESTTAQRDAMLAGLRSLKGIKSAAEVHVGVPAPMPERPVRESSYTYALTVIFKDIASHDAYQIDPVHKAFTEAFRPLWARIQVFDAM